MRSGTENHEKNWIIWEVLIKSIIAQIIMMSVPINMVQNIIKILRK